MPLAVVFRLLIKSRVLLPCSADWGCELVFAGSKFEKISSCEHGPPEILSHSQTTADKFLSPHKEAVGWASTAPWPPGGLRPTVLECHLLGLQKTSSPCLCGLSDCFIFHPGSGHTSRSSMETQRLGTQLGTPKRWNLGQKAPELEDR